MYIKSSFSGTWKHQRWKWGPKFYSTLSNLLSEYRQPSIKSTNIAITELARDGQLDSARKLFDEMRHRTVVSWNAMISAYSKRGRFDEALSLLSPMHHSDIKLNETTFSSVLSACARSPSPYAGKQVHGLVIKSGSECFELVGSALLYFYASCWEIGEARRVFDVFHEENVLLWNLMLVGYVHCNLLDDALDVFNRMPTRDVFAWTTMISGYSKSDSGLEKALELFSLMRLSCEAVPNAFTLDCTIRACGSLGSLSMGRAVHGLLIRCGFEFERSINGALIDFYCNCKEVVDAKRAYDGILRPSVTESNMLIEGFIALGRIEDAESIFKRLDERNPITCNLMIKGYSLVGQFENSKKLFVKMPHRTLASSNTMISVYSRYGELDKALELFEETKEQRNPITWNSMISGYIYNSQHDKALKLYLTMHRQRVGKSRSTFSALFHACSCLGSLQQGQVIHAHLVKTPFLSNVYVGTALVDMYAKCGSIPNAQLSFSSITNPNVAAWTALINGYAYHGLCFEVILLLKQMIAQGVQPNSTTFTGVLSACAHAGLVDEGMRFFHAMKENYGITQRLEHFTCAVDLLGRSGRILEAEELINGMTIKADSVIWGVLLNACWVWMNMEVGERVAEKMISFNRNPISVYVIMSNIYAGLGKWKKKMEIRKKLRSLEVKKDPGCSWIELSSKIFVFSVEDRTHPCCDIIYETLEHLTANFNSIVRLDMFSSL